MTDQQTIEQKINSIRAGHGTGGYCDTTVLQAEEKKLHALLIAMRDDPRSKPETKDAIAKQLRGLSYRPRMVEAKEDK